MINHDLKAIEHKQTQQHTKQHNTNIHPTTTKYNSTLLNLNVFIPWISNLKSSNDFDYYINYASESGFSYYILTSLITLD